MVANGTPRPSVSTWRLLPSLPRSVELGPTAAAGVRVVGAVAPSPDSHRPLARPTGCPALGRPAAGMPPTDVATPRSSPTAESGHAPWLPSRTRLAVLATGSPSATHTAPRPVPAGVHPRPPAFGVLRRPQDRLGDRPQLVWHAPDRRQHLRRYLALVQVLPPAE